MGRDGGGGQLCRPSSEPSRTVDCSGEDMVKHLCRICRKKIMMGETCHYCDSCNKAVCDDCSSYSDRNEAKVSNISKVCPQLHSSYFQFMNNIYLWCTKY